MRADLSQADVDYWAPRRCLRDPVPEIGIAAALLGEAADAFLVGDYARAELRIREADRSEIREWIESLWGARKDNPDQQHYHRLRPLDPLRSPLPKALRAPARMPSTADKAEILARDGWNCRYCGIPLVDTRARNVLQRYFPDALRWGVRNVDKHSAFQCMVPEYDHILPHSHGGTSSLENTILCCGPCNCGKFNRLLDEHGLIDPRSRSFEKSDWDGLTRLL